MAWFFFRATQKEATYIMWQLIDSEIQLEFFEFENIRSNWYQLFKCIFPKIPPFLAKWFRTHGDFLRLPGVTLLLLESGYSMLINFFELSEYLSIICVSFDMIQWMVQKLRFWGFFRSLGVTLGHFESSLSILTNFYELFEYFSIICATFEMIQSKV